MPVMKIDIAAVEKFADGHEFGEAGPYVRVHGVARGVLDPAAAENAGIVDLDKAPRNAAAWSSTPPTSTCCGRRTRARQRHPGL